MIQSNPYNCTEPGNLFVGFKATRKDILTGLLNASSFAIIGGRRCGKTSFLIQLKHDVEGDVLAPLRPLPRYIDIQGLGSVTPGRLFEEIYRQVMRGLDVPPWKAEAAGREYEAFLNSLSDAEAQLSQAYGSNWLAILLIDELDSAVAHLKDDFFFSNLRNLLMVSDYRRHFRLVASGVGDMACLIREGSPLNNLRVRYLGVVDEASTRRLVQRGFESDLDAGAEKSLEVLTGRHPYLLQGLLEKLWPDRDRGITSRHLAEAAQQFLREHSDFRRWIHEFGQAEHAVYRCLAESEDGRRTIVEIRDRIDGSLSHQIDDAIVVLAYHGVIDDGAQDQPRVAGTLFRDWYMSRYPVARTTAAHTPSEGVVAVLDPKRVFIIYGRNVAAYNEMVKFLRSIKLDPKSFYEVSLECGQNPTVLDIVRRGMEQAAGVIALFTPDEWAVLRPAHDPTRSLGEESRRWQARPNVIFEAGWAMGYAEDRSILVKVGRELRLFSDVGGIHTVNLDNGHESRNLLRNRLRLAGCDPDMQTGAHLNHAQAGDFESCVSFPGEPLPIDSFPKSASKLKPVSRTTKKDN